MTEGDRAIIINISAKVAKEVIKDVMKFHIAACPVGKKLTKFKFMMIGACIGSGLAGGVGALGILKIVMGL